MKGQQKLDLAYGNHRIIYATPFPILVSLNEQPVSVLNSGSGRLVLRKAKGVLTLDPSEPKGTFNIDCTSHEVTEGEKFDDLPPPQPHQSPNWLTQIRQQVKNSMGIIREEFAEQGKTMYEVTDDEAEEMRQLATAAQDQPDATSDEEATTPPTDASGAVSEPVNE